MASTSQEHPNEPESKNEDIDAVISNFTLTDDTKSSPESNPVDQALNAEEKDIATATHSAHAESQQSCRPKTKKDPQNPVGPPPQFQEPVYQPTTDSGWADDQDGDKDVDSSTLSLESVTLSADNKQSADHSKKPPNIPNVTNLPLQDYSGPLPLAAADTDTHVAEFKGNLSKPYTTFQGDILRGFLGNRLKSKMRNLMFVIFETGTRLLFYHYYISTTDKLHSEYYLDQDRDNIGSGIKSRVIDLHDWFNEPNELNMTMTILSKNSSCNVCATIHEYIQKLRDAINSDENLPNIDKTEVQILQIYERENNDMTKEEHLKGIEYYRECGINTVPMDFKMFYAIYVQWCSTRKDCRSLTDCSKHTHEIDDDEYRRIIITLSTVNDKLIKQELLRLAKVDSKEESDKKDRNEQQRHNFFDRSGCLEDRLSQYSGDSDVESMTSTNTNTDLGSTN